MTLIWACLDDRAGNKSQAIGVMEALGLPFIEKNIRFTTLGRVANFFKGSSLFGLTKASKQELCSPWPDIVITIATKMEPVGLYIKKQNPAARIVHIQKPHLPEHKFDLIASPEHDYLNKERNALAACVPSNVLLTLGAPNRINYQTLAQGREKWEAAFSKLAHPRIAVLVGGSTNKGKFTNEIALDLAEKANALAAECGGSLLVTTSRRTPPEAIEILREKLQSQKYFYDARSQDENPYAGLLACCDIIIASGDSVSMCSESCSTGKPVYIYSPASLTPPKYRYFQRRLVEGGYARMLGEKKGGEYQPLCDAKIIAECIRKNYCL
jgi:hypothetical protein